MKFFSREGVTTQTKFLVKKGKIKFLQAIRTGTVPVVRSGSVIAFWDMMEYEHIDCVPMEATAWLVKRLLSVVTQASDKEWLFSLYGMIKTKKQNK